MGSVTYASFSRRFTIYRPLDAPPGAAFETITIPDDSLSQGTIYEGDVVVIQRGLIDQRGLHAVLTPAGEKYVGFLVEKGDGLVSIECNNDEYEPEVYRRDEIQILGRVVQVYPQGVIHERWEWHRSHPAA